MLRKTFFAFWAIFCTCALAAVEITSQSVLVIPEKPTTFEKQAAEDFNRIFKRICGAPLQISHGTVPEGKSAVLLGDTPQAAEAGVSSGKLKPEEVVIQVRGNSVIVNGGVMGGTVFAVYDFFRNYANCEWYDPWCTKIPESKSVTIPEGTDFRQSPAFNYRKIFTVATGCDWREKDFARAVHGSDWNSTLGIGAPGMVHNFYLYSRYWPKTNLKLFAMNEKGKRTLPRGQIGPNFCLSNPECSQRVEAQLRKWIKQDAANAERKGIPAPDYYFIDANDITKYFCLCPECKREAEQYGYSGQLLRFLNPIAERIAKDYPRILIGTNAYEFTTDPPKGGVVPAHNIMIRLSHVDGEYYRPITQDRISEFSDLVKKWSKIAKTLSIWDYWIFYWDEFAAPYTNVHILADNIRFYRDNGTKVLFAESEAWETSNFFSLRLYLGYRLMLNPDADAAQLIHKFMEGFYGKGGFCVEEYLHYLAKRQKEVPADQGFAVFRKGAQLKTRPYLDAEFFRTADALFQKAEAAAAGDDMALKNIRRERMIVDCAMLNMWTKLNLSGNFQQVLARYEAERREHIAFRVAKDSQPEALATMNSELNTFRNAEVILRQKQKPLPQLTVPKSTDWTKSATLTQWFEHQGFPSSKPLMLKMRHDGKMIWVRLTEKDVTRKLRSAPHIWEGDEWEVMLTARKENRHFLHLLVDCEGKVQILMDCEKGEIDGIPKDGFVIRSRIAGSVWCVELGIPRSKIPGTGNTLYGNFFRSASKATSAQCWSPVFDGEFRRKNRFGTIHLE